MILHALYDYYRRKSDTGELAPEGYSWKEIPFLIVISPEGRFIQLSDTRTAIDRRQVPKSFLLPKEVERSGARAFEKANFLWDHYGYVLGHPKSDDPKGVEMAKKQFLSFREKVSRAADAVPNSSWIRSVVRFLEDAEQIGRVFVDPLWPECARIPGCNLSFVVAGEVELVGQDERLGEYVRTLGDDGKDEDDSEAADDAGAEALCIVSGEIDRIARLHPRTPIKDSKSNAKLVSFQKSCGFDSYGKEQSYNAPVGERAAFAYTTALNHLLRKGSLQRMQVGDASTVFWAADVQPSPFEQDFAAMFGEAEKDDPDRGAHAVRNLYRSTETGVYTGADGPARFCVLGLAPNAARIAVRFWQVAPVGELALHIRKHFDDIELTKPTFEKPYLSLFRLLTSIALQGKAENIPPDLAGDTMRSILSGRPYPAMLLQAAVRRIRADQTVDYPRAAILKASLNRLIRQRQTSKEFPVSLDRNNTDPAYCLGRLFATLERIQGVAQPGINATIRERYYGAASSAPASVFPVLLKLKNHHLAKIDKPGLVVWFEKLLGEIFGGLNAIPSRLSLAEQGAFAIGYYHQQQDFFASKRQPDSDVATDTDNQGETE